LSEKRPKKGRGKRVKETGEEGRGAMSKRRGVGSLKKKKKQDNMKGVQKSLTSGDLYRDDDKGRKR